ncbi:MAG: hypothetical protein ABR609_14215 [Acidimicrobiia bacterium]
MNYTVEVVHVNVRSGTKGSFHTMSSTRSVGAYGFRLEGAGQRLLVPAPPDWPLIRVVQEVAEPAPPPSLEIGDQHATVPLIGGGMVTVDRHPPQAVFKVPHHLTEDEIAHPYLGPIAALHAHWLGRQAFHGGAMVVGDRAWGVLGRRQAGKSSLLAEAQRRGVPVLADDLLVFEGRNVFAAPRSLDLRQPAALHFGSGRLLGVVGQRERWRVELTPVPVCLPLAGWIFLRWGPEPGTELIGIRDRLVWLAASRTVKVDSSDPAPLLRLAALPALQLTGLKRWETLSPLFDSLLETIAGLETPV